MKADAVVRLKFSSERPMAIIFKALQPEVKRSPTMRSQALLQKDDKFLILTIAAEDTVALRAAVNAYLGWINSIVNVLESMRNIS